MPQQISNNEDIDVAGPASSPRPARPSPGPSRPGRARHRASAGSGLGLDQVEAQAGPPSPGFMVDAQHAFSADLRSTLHLAIPALKKLHAEWTVKSTKPKYSVFHDAIDEALQKVDEYYQKSSNSNSYMFAMVLDPREKFSYFEKHWPEALQTEFKERYLEIHSVTAQTPLDEDETMSDLAATHIDPLRPCLDEYKGYMAARESVPE
ncbi:hypothetical protein DFH08DRAFT_929063 [Mycena albidolilacea]|uniref:Uncharacterized protein n=1 Tax=Mycena albidolilacea TaxID=1033008 RepID=A0AAD7AW53_9AGAR|nr:hypothetical protein DFH08DRAFT_929063 [Mycena albidolilacea]